MGQEQSSWTQTRVLRIDPAFLNSSAAPGSPSDQIPRAATPPNSGPCGLVWSLTHPSLGQLTVLSSVQVKAWVWAWRSGEQARDVLKGEWTPIPPVATPAGARLTSLDVGGPPHPSSGFLPPSGEEGSSMNNTVQMKKPRHKTSLGLKPSLRESKLMEGRGSRGIPTRPSLGLLTSPPRVPQAWQPFVHVSQPCNFSPCAVPSWPMCLWSP